MDNRVALQLYYSLLTLILKMHVPVYWLQRLEPITPVAKVKGEIESKRQPTKTINQQIGIFKYCLCASLMFIYFQRACKTAEFHY